MIASMTHLGGIVGRGARSRGRVALEDCQGGRRVTYGELDRRARQGAARLRAAGLRTGDRVLLVMESTPDWMPAFFAILEADLTVVPLPGGTPASLVAFAARYPGVRACIHDASHPAAADIGPETRRFTPADLWVGREVPDETPGTLTNPTAVLAFTSGSTARPRVVALGHDAILSNLRSLLRVRQAAPDEALLSVLPPSHLYELVAGQLAPLASGSRLVYGGPPLPNRLVDTVRCRAITRILLVPALVEGLARELLEGLAADGLVSAACPALGPAEVATHASLLRPGARRDLCAAVRARLGPSLRSVAVGGAALDPGWVDLLHLIGLDVDIGYGLTEAGPLVSLGLASRSPRGSVGRPLPGVDVQIAGDGEILVRSASLMQGYAGDPAGTAAVLPDGWLRTGDRGHLDASGYLSIAGRIKESIVTASGETRYPDEIEPYYASPHFAEHCVVPLPAADGNDRACLVVVPAAGADPAGLEEIFAAQRAAAPPGCRVSSMIQRSDPLPRTALGKIRRRLLADVLAEPASVGGGRP